MNLSHSSCLSSCSISVRKVASYIASSQYNIFVRTQQIKKNSHSIALLSICLVAITLSACGSGAEEAVPPTPTVTPTALPTSTPQPTPEPTQTPQPTLISGEESESNALSSSSATVIATPQVTIPSGYTPSTDSRLGYSLAIPGGWTELDLRSGTFQNLARTAGMGAQLEPLNTFLDSEEGKSLGAIYITDLSAAIFGGLPTLLNVSVVDAPDATPEDVIAALTELLEQNASALGDVTINSMAAETINNIPSVKGDAVVDLSQAGMDVELFAKVVGLIANDKIYVLTMATQSNKMTKYDPIFEQVIGTFRPE